MTEAPERAKLVGDMLGIAAVTSSWLGLLSQLTTIIATTLAAIWSGIRLYEWWKVKRESLRRGKQLPPAQ